MRDILNILYALLIGAFIVSDLYAQLPPRHVAHSEWLMLHGSMGHNGYGALKGNITSFSVKYTVSLSNSEGEPGVGDVNGDGVPEIIVPTSTNLYAVNGPTGTILWAVPMSAPYAHGVALGDLIPTNPGLEIVEGNTLRRGSDGSVIWTASCVSTSWGMPAPLIASEGSDTLVVFHSTSGQLCAVRGSDGSVVWTATTGGGSYCCAPAAGDINGDGSLEVVVNDYSGTVRAYRLTDGTLLWSRSLGSPYFTSVSLGDINGDCIDEVIAYGNYRIYALNGTDGSTIWSYSVGKVVEGTPSVGDLNGDGLADVIVGLDGGCDYIVGEWLAISGTGTLLWSYAPSGVDMPCVHGAGRLILDIDNDGELEVALVPYGSPWYGDGIMRVLKASNGMIEWTSPAGSVNMEGSAFADVDGDGCAELVSAPTCCTPEMKVFDISGSGCGLYPYNDTCGTLGYDDPVGSRESFEISEFTVEGGKGYILITSTKENMIRIYNLQGSLVYAGKVKGRKRIELKRGSYFLKSGGYSTSVIVR